MIGMFNLNQTLASNSAADPDDTLNTKRALGSLGYYEAPSFGMTEYPDEGLFNGIKSFQKDNDLTKDGVMKPAGETATQLGKTLAARRTANNPLRSNNTDNKEQDAIAWPEPFPKKPKASAPASTPSKTAFTPLPPKSLKKAVGLKQPNRAGDVGTAIGQLVAKGIYALRNRQQDAVVKNVGLENAIKAFQTQNALTVDGVMKPGGETDTALRQSLDARAQQLTSETPSDPGQDDPDEPDDITPRPPGDQHPPEKPEKPDEDDGKDKRPATGPCSDLYFKSLEANQALYEVRQQVWANDQDIENTEQEIAELKGENVKDNADDLMMSGKIRDTRDSSPIKAIVGFGRRTPIGRALTIAEISANVGNKAENNAESRQKIAELEVKLENLRAEQVRLVSILKEANAKSSDAAKKLRECQAKYN